MIPGCPFLLDPSALAVEPATPRLPLWWELSLGAVASLVTAVAWAVG